MKLALAVLATLVVGGAAATTSWAPVTEDDNEATMQHVPRVATAPCAPVHLHLVVTDAAQANVVSGLLWQAGIPPGSTVDFAWPDGAGLRVPPDAGALWAASVLAC